MGSSEGPKVIVGSRSGTKSGTDSLAGGVGRNHGARMQLSRRMGKCTDGKQQGGDGQDEQGVHGDARRISASTLRSPR